MKKNLKDKLSNFAGIVSVISGAILTAGTSGAKIPSELMIAAGIGASIGVGMVSWLTGKAPNGKEKAL